MKLNSKILGAFACSLCLLPCGASRALAADAYPVFTDPNVDGLAFGGTDIFSFGGNYSVNDAAQLEGNHVVSFSQFGVVMGGTGAGLSVPISNGENGIDSSFDGAANDVLNPDIPNTTPPNPAFAAIGNASGKLENGNVIRYSAWYRSDPANPITVDPQIQPVLKIELWKEALSTLQDTNPGVQPTYGDKVFDQDQHGGALGIPVDDKAQWIDFNGDGVVIDAAAAGEGRVSQLSTSEWTLVETSYTVDDSWWIGIADDVYTVADIEEVRAVMFVGDFTSTNLAGDGDGGNLLVDNVLVEVFKDAASVTPNANPLPTAPAGLPGDYNEDNVVDAADYTVWRDSLGGVDALPNDDTTGVGQDDYDRWKTNFGMTLPGEGSGSLSASAVPEPTTLLLVAAGIVAAAMMRRSKQ